jgi:hypothetical protein
MSAMYANDRILYAKEGCERARGEDAGAFDPRSVSAVVGQDGDRTG